MNKYDVFIRYNNGEKEPTEELYICDTLPQVIDGMFQIITETEKSLIVVPCSRIFSVSITKVEECENETTQSES